MKFDSRIVRPAVAILLAGTLCLPLTGGSPDRTSAAVEPHRPDRQKSVSGSAVPVLPKPPSEVDRRAQHGNPKVTWPAPSVATVAIEAAGDRATARETKAGDLPIWIAPAGPWAKEGVPSRVRVEVLDRDASRRAGVDGLVVKLGRADGKSGAGRVSLSIDYSSFREAYGGDWANRLRLTTLDGRTRSTIPTRADAARSRITAEVPVASERTYALTAAPSGSTGDFGATSLAPAGTWSTSLQSGGFSWVHTMRTPPVPGGLVPDLSLSYSSTTVDGRTASTNNQSTWIGEGWSLWPGFIERSYQACADDLGGNNGQTKTGDLCWETENATMSFGAHSGRLVLANGTWRPENDDGTRIEKVLGATNGDNDGEYWKITTTDGTQYIFGAGSTSAWSVPVFGNDSNEPCRQATFAASSCTQTYRWNLDRVVDPHGNTLTYVYAPETNKYAVNLGATTASYTRGGTLARIDYGTREGQSGPAPAQVIFTTTDRCLPGADCAAKTPSAWPDVPWDQDCSTATCPGRYSPTFWSTKRLATVTTQISTGGTTYRTVESWSLKHDYPAPGDGTTPSLWLSGISHRAGNLTTPDVTFDGGALTNRVDSASDGLPKLNKYRLQTINTETGGTISVRYADPDCAPGALPSAADTNTKRCFPVRWTMPPAVTPVDEWFHKYVVAGVSEVDRVGGGRTQFTGYKYDGGGAWAFDDNPLVPLNRRTWSEWRGYGRVVVQEGDAAGEPGKPASETEHRYFRGMHGDRLAGGGTKTDVVTDSAGGTRDDLAPYGGVELETITRNGVDGPAVSTVLSTPWNRLTAVQGSLKAYQVEIARSTNRTALSAGGFRTTETETTYDEYGNALKVHDKGDVEVAADDLCTTTSYVKNLTSWMVSLPSVSTTAGGPCGPGEPPAADLLSATRTAYDGAAPGAVPVKGDATRSEVAKSFGAGGAEYLAVDRTSYDGYGRPASKMDALGNETVTRYTETNGLTAALTVTNALGHATTTSFEPSFGQATASVDANQRRTDLSHDALGRTVAVWAPGRRKDVDGPTSRYAYGVRSDGPSWVKTDTLRANDNYVSSYTLLDGFLRDRQTQAPSPKGGRILSDTTYDSRGLVSRTRSSYYNKDAVPGTGLFAPQDNQVPAATSTTYDGVGRETAVIELKLNVEASRTKISYGGDRVTTTPPRGATTVTSVNDAHGRQTELRQHKPGGYDTTKYTYDRLGRQTAIVDPAGNRWSYEYDVLGRKVRSTDPDRGLSTATYNDLGQAVTHTDARGKTNAATYDALGRRTATRAGSVNGPVLASWTYDTMAKGLLTSSTRHDGDATVTRAVTGLDEAGRPIGEQVQVPTAVAGQHETYATASTYRSDGSLASVQLPALGNLPAETITYDYDDLGLPVKTEGAAVYVADIEYNELGEQSQVTLGEDGGRVWRTTYYDELTRRPNRVLTERELAQQVIADDRAYAYDPAGNVTATSALTAGASKDNQCFGYDHLRRMTEAWTPTGDCAGGPVAGTIGGPAPYWQTFGYDLTGNRTSLVNHGIGGAPDRSTSYRHAGAGRKQPHAVTSMTSSDHRAAGEFGYDQAGNLISRPGPTGPQTLSWQDDGSLGSITSGSTTTSFGYDAGGSQLIRRDAGKLTVFVGSGEVTYDLATKTTTGTRYYEGVAVRTPAGLTWLVGDQHGTAQLAIDQKTLASTVRRTDPFGNARGQTPGWRYGSRGFVGGVADTGTGLTRLGARDYDPLTGRFITVDPILDQQDPQQLNGYAYSNNNPATMSDPSGLLGACPDGSCRGQRGGGRTNSPVPETRRPDKASRRPGVSYGMVGPIDTVPRKCSSLRNCVGPAVTASKPKGWHPPMLVPASQRSRGLPPMVSNNERLWQRNAAAKAAADEAARARVPRRTRQFAADEMLQSAANRRRMISDELANSLGMDTGDPQIDQTLAILNALGGLGASSVSVCSKITGGFGFGVRSESCLNFDATGITSSYATKMGITVGVEGTWQPLVIRVNGVSAAEVSATTGKFSVAAGVHVGLGIINGAEVEIGDPFGKFEPSFAVKSGFGVAGSVGGAYGTIEAGNTGYIRRW